MKTTIPTIRRQKWHGTMRWQAQDQNGQLFAYNVKPRLTEQGLYWGIAHHGGIGQSAPGPHRTPPRDYTTTLRRIAPARKGSKP